MWKVVKKEYFVLETFLCITSDDYFLIGRMISFDGSVLTLCHAIRVRFTWLRKRNEIYCQYMTRVMQDLLLREVCTA